MSFWLSLVFACLISPVNETYLFFPHSVYYPPLTPLMLWFESFEVNMKLKSYVIVNDLLMWIILSIDSLDEYTFFYIYITTSIFLDA